MKATIERVDEGGTGGWERCRLGDPDISTIIMGQSPDSATYNTSRIGLPFFQGKADFGLRHPSPTTWCSAPTRIAQAGDILVSVRAPVGDVNLAVEPCCIGRGIATLRPGSRMAGEFLFYMMLHRKIDLDRLGSGAIFSAINKDTLHDFAIDVPPLAEQQAIGEVLTKLQAAVEVQTRIVAALRALKAATMAKLFREGLRVEPLKQTEIGEIPQSWDVRALGDIAEVSTGTTPATERADYYSGDIPFVKTAEIDNNVIRFARQHVSKDAVRDYTLRVYPPGSVLLAMYGQGKTRGRASLLGIRAATTQNTAAIEPGDSARGEFIWHYLLSQYNALRSTGNLGHLSHLNLGYVKALRIPLPPFDKQREIERVLSTLQRRLELAAERHKALRALFSSMLELLMTGQVRVKRSAAAGGEETRAQSNSERPKEFQETLDSVVAELVRPFGPDRVILFGQHAEGSPRAFGEVGLLVEMDFEGLARDQAARIAREVPHDMSLDLVVRRPADVARAMEMGDRFVGGIVERGKLLYARLPGEIRPARVLKSKTKAVGRPARMLSEQTLEEIIERIVEAVQPEQIILFGSAARGDMGPDSDVDLMVVKACSNPREIAQRTYQSLRGVARGLPKDIVVVTPEDVERDRDTIGYIIRPAIREGRVVYAA